MKSIITFQTSAEVPTNRLLLHFTVLLHQMRIDLESIHWTKGSGKDEATNWTMVMRDMPRLKEFAADLASSTDVHNVRLNALAPSPLKLPAAPVELGRDDAPPHAMD